MRAVEVFFVRSFAAAAVLLCGCGSTTSDLPGGSTGVDSGTSTDATTPVGDSSLFDDGPAEASEDAAPKGDGGCAFGDADLFTSTPPDAALDDAGASIGTCLACAQTKCKAQVTGCDKDACCEGIFDCAFSGLATGQCLTLEGCAFNCYTQEPAGTTLDSTEKALEQCAAKSCVAECAVCSFSPSSCPAPDAGSPSDAGSDAADAADAAED